MASRAGPDPDAPASLGAPQPPAWAAALLEAAPEPILLCDGAGRVFAANEAAGALFGLGLGTLVTHRVPELLAEDLGGDPRSRGRVGAGHPAPWPLSSGDTLVTTGDGQGPTAVDVTVLPAGTGNPAWFLLLLHPVAERRRTEAELRYKKALLESQNEASVDGILIVDHDSRVVSMNQRFIEMWDVPEHLLQVGGKDDEALASVLGKLEDPDEFLAKIEWLHEHPDAETRDEVRFRDGRVFERWSTPVYGQDSTYYGRGWYFRDITERKRSEEAMARHAREQARLTELEQLLTVTSHNLVTPLRTMLLYTQLLERRYHGALDEDADEFIAYIISGARQMRDLLADLRTYAEIGSRESQARPVPLGEVVERARRSLAELLEGTAGRIEASELPTIQADPAQLQILLEQLVENALKFRSGAPPRVRLAAQRRGQEWVVSVEDNGIGIEPSHQARVFSLFERLDPEDHPDGTGIGLAICRHVVERHGGRIWLTSPGRKVPAEEGGAVDDGWGTTVFFSLPANGPER